MSRIVLVIAGLAILASLPMHANAHPDTAQEEIRLFGRGVNLIGEAWSGSEGLVGFSDFEYRPISRVGELVEVIPGLVATQHSGSGKSNQYFLRGFNLDHGTDFAVFADGVPVNFRTHGHGQGYVDLNFIIPELVETLNFRKGPYFADVGDFTAAATASFKTYDELPNGIATATIGEAGFRRGLVAGSVPGAGGMITAALEIQFTDSPYILDEELEKYNGLFKYVRDAGTGALTLTLSAYHSTWRSTDQVPLRAIESGLIDRLGFIDPDLGGRTTRVSLSGQYETEDTQVVLYGLYYDFALFSNFTYFANDPVNGDEFEQRDELIMFGGSAHNDFSLGDTITLRVGGDTRFDSIFNLGLFNTTARARFDTVRNDEVTEFSLGSFAEVRGELAPNLRFSVGARVDLFAYDVTADLAANSGDGHDAIFTPTAALAWQVTDRVELFANYGQGFHSNDVRGAATVIDPVTGDNVDTVPVLVRAQGAELGARYSTGDVQLALAGFWLELDSELVFVGDAGTTEPNNGSRRFGVEASAFWRPYAWLALDVSAAYTDAQFSGVDPLENNIPQAVESVIGAGMVLGPFDGFTASARLRHFGEAPLIEDNSVRSEPTTVVNLGAYYDIGPFQFGLDVLNLLDSKDADITYFFESQLPGEAVPVEDIHLHPVEPRQIRGSLTIRF
ncbi:MAG: TonB-dependent receptor [Pseudomonadota bacterium]